MLHLERKKASTSNISTRATQWYDITNTRRGFLVQELLMEKYLLEISPLGSTCQIYKTN